MTLNFVLSDPPKPKTKSLHHDCSLFHLGCVQICRKLSSSNLLIIKFHGKSFSSQHFSNSQNRMKLERHRWPCHRSLAENESFLRVLALSTWVRWDDPCSFAVLMCNYSTFRTSMAWRLSIIDWQDSHCHREFTSTLLYSTIGLCGMGQASDYDYR